MLRLILLAIFATGLLGVSAASSHHPVAQDDPIPLCPPDSPNCTLGGPK